MRALPAFRMSRPVHAAVLLLFTVLPGLRAQRVAVMPPNRANWELAERFSTANMRNLTFSTAVAPRFFGETDSLFYNWRDRNGGTFYLVVPGARLKRPLFDHIRMAEELSRLHRKPYEANRLPFTTLNVTRDHKKLRFVVDSTRYEWDLAGQTLAALPKLPRDSIARDEEGATGGLPEWRAYSPDSTAFAFAREHNLFVVEVATKDTLQLSTDGVKDYSYGALDTTVARQQDSVRQGGARPREPRVLASVTWSPDSRAFAVVRRDSRKVKELYLVNALSSPRPTLTSYRYSMPGEVDVSQGELSIFTRGTKALRRVPAERWKDQQLSNVHWPVNASRLRLTRTDRLQRNLELVEFDAATLTAKSLLSETVENAQLESQPVRYVKRGGDFVWFSERNGWGHYYLYSHDGVFKRSLTSGPWRASTVVAQDTLAGTLFLGGVGLEQGPTPYLRHVYRVNGDGSGWIRVTDGPYDHGVIASPTRKYLIDNYSRIDTLAVAVLRDAVTGRVLLPLEVMDDSRLREMGWRPAEPFVVKAADGVTDIYGTMRKPLDFDSTRKYPIVAYVYPGPQMEQVTTGFSTGGVAQQLAQLGFIVVEIGNRGGTPNRSNAYHSYGYFNLRDYALADKKVGIEQLAARHPWIDLTRVGIYGHSGGGFLTAAALLLPPYNDFFRVGVASSGNHDNNIYNQNWSESNHGLRVVIQKRDTTRKDSVRAGTQQLRNGARVVTIDDTTSYEIRVPTNAELAGNLKGKLLLTTGDMDNNVHPGNTIRLVDALIKANKRFDMMILPGQAHGYGTMQPYFNRMLLEYFAEHLLGDNYRHGADMPQP